MFHLFFCQFGMLSFFKEFVHFILVVACSRHEVIHISFIFNIGICVLSLLFLNQFCYDLTNFINQVLALLTCYIVSLWFSSLLSYLYNECYMCTEKNVYYTVVDCSFL